MKWRSATFQKKRIQNKYQFSSVPQSCLTLCHPMDCSTPGFTPHQSSLSIANSWSWLKLMSVVSVMPYNHLILCYFSFSLQSLPAWVSFSVSWLFSSGGQSSGVSASASALPMNVQGWCPLGLTGWISLKPKGLSRVFSNTTVQKRQFFSTQLSL